MSVSVAAILGEFKQIERRSPEDVAVLMTPLLRALEAVRDGRDPQLDHAQVLAMANSLAQTAAQAGDVDAAVAIATASAELEQLAPETFAPRNGRADGTPAAAGAAAPETSRRPSISPFAHPSQQLLGIIGICGLSYAGYVAILARIPPESVAGWLLTGSSSLLALALGLGWRRFVLHRRRGPALTLLALVFAASATVLAVQTASSLLPQMATAQQDAAPAAPPETPADSSDDTADATATSPHQTPVPNPGPIAFWWLGDAPTPRSTSIPRHAADAATAPASGQAASNPPGAKRAGATEHIASTAPMRPASSPPRRDAPSEQSATRYTPPLPRQPQTPQERYRGLLEREVVVTDVKGMRHQGKLTGISKYGVTLLMEVQLFGQPILAQRFYLFDDIETLHAK
ncbi:MAG: hypothetical protein LJE69_03000 [Thiohalocapsa sp.]|jgi:hypothetical protein|uniref:hypothetical protein n=1 Tax=Thiohalocapsa sp. TaxID=2497641 RepID=UPI0025D081C9|nr:hypothetical protein [Thiohalocapsa sp.]MCG6940201.1 hypothetical protein [Thiohalocapsa sp.]